MAYIPNSGSVVAFQGQPSSLLVGASIVGLTPVNVTNTVNVSGSVASFIQGNASIITVSQGSIAVTIVSGSIAASFTPPANQSVSGTVGASIIGLTPVNVSNTTLNVSGSVAAWLNSSNASVITLIQGSVAVTVTPAANQSVSGVVMAQGKDAPAASITGNPLYMGGRDQNGSMLGAAIGTNREQVITGSVQGTMSVLGTVPVTQSTSPWIITGSVQGSFSPSGNQSVSGTVGASIVGQLPAGTAVLGSIMTLQGTNPWIITGSVQATAAANQSVSGTVNIAGNPSISGTVQIGNTNVNVSGSVVAFVTGNPSVSGTVGASIIGIAPVTLTANTVPAASSILVGVTANTNGSVLSTIGYPQAVVQITSGPGASITGVLNFEGTQDGTQFVPIQGYNLTTNAISSMATIEGDWSFNTAGLQGIRTRVSNWTVGSITARAVVSPSDARALSQIVVGTPSVSGTLGASIVGQLPAGSAVIGSVAVLQATSPWNVAGSVAAFFVGNASVITVAQNSSIIAINAGSVVALSSGSVITIQQAPSVVGTYLEDNPHTNADRGLFTLMVRNDTVSSITSNDLDYSPHVVDAVGRTIIKPFAGENATIISYVGSIVSGSVQLIQASVIGSRSYITDFWLSNTGAATTLVTFQGGDTSIVGQFIAPTTGGMASPGIAIPLKTTLSQDLAFKVATATSVLYLVVKGYQAP